MRTNRCTASRAILLLVLFLVITFASTAFALPKTATIELVDGTIFRDVQYRVDKTFRIVVIYMEGDDKNVSFTEVVKITDEDGEDITVEALGGDYRPARRTPTAPKPPAEAAPVAPAETAPVVPADTTPVAPADTPASEAPAATDTVEPVAPAGQPKPPQAVTAAPVTDPKKKVRTAPFDVGVQINAAFSVPIGTWFEGLDPDIGFNGDIFVRLSHELALRATVGKAGISFDDANVDVSIVRYYLSLQYYSWERWRRGNRTMLYAYTGLGAVTHKFSSFGYSSETIAKFSTVLGAGLTHLFADRTALQAGLTYDLLYIGKVDDGDTHWGMYGDNIQTAGIFEIQVGIVQFF